MAADTDIDIIDVGIQPSFRYDMVMAALSNGKHVYNALPVNTQRAKEMAQAQAVSCCMGVVDAQFRWVPAAMHMMDFSTHIQHGPKMVLARITGRPTKTAVLAARAILELTAFYFCPTCPVKSKK